MKKKICTLLVLIASVVSAYATDGITAQNISIPKSNISTLEIDLTSETNKYGGFQFELQLPTGISATGIQKSSRLTSVETDNDHFNAQIKLIDETNNVYQVLVFIVNSDPNHLIDIAGTSGEVAIVTLAADDTVEPGTNLEGQLNQVVLSTVGANQVNSSDSKFTITILAPLPVVTLKETNEKVPAASDGAVDVKVERTINANEWSTIVLPFDMNETQVKFAFGEDVKIADFKGWSFEGDYDNVSSISIQFKLVGAIERHHPYVIKVGNNITSFIANNVVITQTSKNRDPQVTNSGEDGYDKGSIIGTYKARPMASNDIFLSGNKFWYAMSGSKSIKGFRATFRFVDDDNNPILINDNSGSRITMSFDEPTGINEVKIVEDDKFYNLSGQQVKPQKKGLYIQNGKKKIIK